MYVPSMCPVFAQYVLSMCTISPFVRPRHAAVEADTYLLTYLLTPCSRGERHLQDFSGKTLGKETTWETQA
jgi:hypothetical protein